MRSFKGMKVSLSTGVGRPVLGSNVVPENVREGVDSRLDDVSGECSRDEDGMLCDDLSSVKIEVRN